ncbi:hypothetical protein [Miltoncostaea oceani]|uniref:hypothetical protein n=1 Tax=Miltoncostaea oceani TaxID=2843216 RepID=UPI001C3E5CDA|nr:hypothetical protein [Miltoncostaea oceani]
MGLFRSREVRDHEARTARLADVGLDHLVAIQGWLPTSNLTDSLTSYARACQPFFAAVTLGGAATTAHLIASRPQLQRSGKDGGDLVPDIYARAMHVVAIRLGLALLDGASSPERDALTFTCTQVLMRPSGDGVFNEILELWPRSTGADRLGQAKIQAPWLLAPLGLDEDPLALDQATEQISSGARMAASWLREKGPSGWYLTRVPLADLQ